MQQQTRDEGTQECEHAGPRVVDVCRDHDQGDKRQRNHGTYQSTDRIDRRNDDPRLETSVDGNQHDGNDAEELEAVEAVLVRLDVGDVRSGDVDGSHGVSPW